MDGVTPPPLIATYFPSWSFNDELIVILLFGVPHSRSFPYKAQCTQHCAFLRSFYKISGAAFIRIRVNKFTLYIFAIQTHLSLLKLWKQKVKHLFTFLLITYFMVHIHIPSTTWSRGRLSESIIEIIGYAVFVLPTFPPVLVYVKTLLDCMWCALWKSLMHPLCHTSTVKEFYNNLWGLGTE